MVHSTNIFWGDSVRPTCEIEELFSHWGWWLCLLRQVNYRLNPQYSTLVSILKMNWPKFTNTIWQCQPTIIPENPASVRFSGHFSIEYHLCNYVVPMDLHPLKNNLYIYIVFICFHIHVSLDSGFLKPWLSTTYHLGSTWDLQNIPGLDATRGARHTGRNGWNAHGSWKARLGAG